MTEAELVRRFDLLWPGYFHDRALALPPPRTSEWRRRSGRTARSPSTSSAGRCGSGFRSATLPVLFVHGEESPLPVRGSRDTAALIPDAELVVVPGAGHFPWVERPGSVRDAVEPFLAR